MDESLQDIDDTLISPVYGIAIRRRMKKMYLLDKAADGDRNFGNYLSPGESDSDKEDETNLELILKKENIATAITLHALKREGVLEKKNDKLEKRDRAYSQLVELRTDGMMVADEWSGKFKQRYVVLKKLNHTEGLCIYGDRDAVKRALGEDETSALPRENDNFEIIRDVVSVKDNIREKFVTLITKKRKYTMKFKKHPYEEHVAFEDRVLLWLNMFYRYLAYYKKYGKF
eukprot:CAMPEP_0184490240 /NCGR_PEP_ID=MMETSP0113_2-20130426/17371_1 /TAXON_ID=91329 /ORGANISM="Norrisiella sphaerica, Strain BC52" /LENGTH=229 /DNA_ID=CAMNT_0026874027 /DNA_START=299 /DNA_END=988 /DNA_ORIENTATION=-